MERPLQVSQPAAGTHCECGLDATPFCPEMLSSLLPLTPAGFTPDEAVSVGPATLILRSPFYFGLTAVNGL